MDKQAETSGTARDSRTILLRSEQRLSEKNARKFSRLRFRVKKEGT